MKTNSILAGAALSAALLAPLPGWSQISVSINIGPPPLPVVTQPMIPGDGYLWTPGYWGWSPVDNAYYWVPGTWVQAPAPGLLWTPGYWAFTGGGYRWNQGYWANQVGFYGGINYGYGYTGSGYQGGRWNGNAFAYNRSVNNIDTTVVHNVYNTTVVNNVSVNRVSFNGGQGGTAARPTPQQLQVQAARHVEPTAVQLQHEHMALATPTQRASGGHGGPMLTATARPADFHAPVAAPAHAPNMQRQPPAPAQPMAAAPRPGPAEARQRPAPAAPAARAEAHAQHPEPAPMAERREAPPRAEMHPNPEQQHHAQAQVPHQQPGARGGERGEGRGEEHQQH